jgi:LL-diaminopimelate aminotransferase
VELDPQKEVLPLIGSKEGIGHIALCFIDPGDVALVPDPGYPVYSVGTMLAGGEPYFLPLTEENDFLPDLDAVPEEIARRAKVLWLNYPNNPTGAVADVDFFERAVAFARKHGIAVLHDGPYSEVAFDGYCPASFLQAEGAKDAGIEFHSLSKSYNMTGWRIGMAVGNAKIIDALMRVKSNLDSGVPQAIQRMAIAAFEGPQDAIAEHNRIYQRRRDRLVAALTKLGLRLRPPRASLYLWARVPEGMTSVQFATRLLDDAGVVVTPGIGYGPSGEGYVRLSITIPDDRLEEGVRRMEAIAGKWRT